MEQIVPKRRHKKFQTPWGITQKHTTKKIWLMRETTYPSAYEDGTDWSETSAHKFQTPWGITQKHNKKYDSCERRHTHPPIKMEQILPKRRHKKFQTPCGITQKHTTKKYDSCERRHTHPPIKMEQIGPKRRHKKFQRPGELPRSTQQQKIWLMRQTNNIKMELQLTGCRNGLN